MTYKAFRASDQSVNRALEYNLQLESEQALIFLQKGIDGNVLKKAFGLPFESIWFYNYGCLLTFRSVVPFKDYTLEVDRNEYLGAVDYELECEHSDFEKLEELKGLLKYYFNVDDLPSKTKVERFFERYEQDKK